MDDEFRKDFNILAFLACLVLLLTGYSYADPVVGGIPLSTIQNGTVNGGLYIDSYTGFGGLANESIQSGGRSYVIYDFKNYQRMLNCVMQHYMC